MLHLSIFHGIYMLRWLRSPRREIGGVRVAGWLGLLAQARYRALYRYLRRLLVRLGERSCPEPGEGSGELPERPVRDPGAEPAAELVLDGGREPG